MKNFVTVFIFLIGNIFLSPVYASQPENEKIINIAGIVFDSKSLLPIENVDIYNEKGDVIAKTDSKGYFIGKLQYTNKEGIKFKIKLGKKGYLPFTQTENWAEFTKGSINTIYYFGIKKADEASDIDSFSQFIFSSDLSFASAVNNFENVLEKLRFNQTISNLRKSGQNSFFEINNSYYLISDTGWIKLESPKSLIYIDPLKKISAENLNSTIQRKDIKDILHTDDGEIKITTYKVKNR
ncbi:hypothetical protein [Chryseobacterium sp. 'Rf worker isolate 10']|uniref:hypothetical protein n=1 Tax=Chryseobacterium sp. 'Rf worker isolate 10' TaxID=2887348 RepID=UPI003D7011E1